MVGKEKADVPPSRLPRDGAAAVAELPLPTKNGASKSVPTKAAATDEPTTKKRRRRRRRGSAKGKRGALAANPSEQGEAGGTAEDGKYPRHSLDQALRIPAAILEQNAGKACSSEAAATFAGLGYHGPTRMKIASAIKYGLLERPKEGEVQTTELARMILRPHKPSDKVEGLRAAIMKAPLISAVYSHYRGENLPDPQFLQNTLRDKFGISQDNIAQFESIFIESLRTAGLVEEHDGKVRVLDFTHSATAVSTDNSKTLDRLGKAAAVKSTDTCFVLMPFGGTIGGYYAQIYEPAIQKAGLTAARADSDIFGTGKIIDQIHRGIQQAKVLVTELTSRNPNVFYELGLAHAMNKPVVMVSGNEADVPFDLRHIRVIYYDTTDPFWGQKLIDKVAENILSALANPEEALFKRALEPQ